MKIAITAKGPRLDSEVDPRFGRAAYILLYDTGSMGFEAIDNRENVNAFKGAGIQAATMIADRGAEMLLTGYCGPNAFRTLQVAGIKVGSDTVGTVAKAIAAAINGEVSFSEMANADGHW